MVIGVVVLAALAVAAATAISRFVTASNESRAYDLARPAQHVCQPEEAVIGIIKDWRDTARMGDAFSEAWTVLPGALTQECQPSTSHPALVVCYRDGNVTFWSAIRNSSIPRLTQQLSHDLSDGYNPVEENLPDGSRLYHFTTADNRFAHLYYGSSVIGFGYNRNRLTTPAYDNNLAHLIDEGSTSAMPAVVYDNTVYRIFDARQDAATCSYRCILHTLPSYLAGQSNSLQTEHIPASASEVWQASCITAPFIGAVVSSVVLADDSTATPVVTATITDRRALGRTLRPYLTPYGYRMTADSLARIVPGALLSSENYWIEVKGTALLASTRARSLQQYIEALRKPQRFAPDSLAPALLTYISTGGAKASCTKLLPERELPPFITRDTFTVQLVTERNNRYRMEFIVPSHGRNKSVANR